MIGRRRLEKIFSSLPRQPVRGTFFRSIDLYWLQSGSPLTAIGSREYGGRYNAKGAFEAFYISDTQLTALHEARAVIRRAAGRIVGVRQAPRVMLSLDCELQETVDLCAANIQKRLGVTSQDLTQPWKLAQEEERPVLTQRIGGAARANGVEALLVPSARVDIGKNLVVFPDRLRKGSRVELVSDERLQLPKYAIEGSAE